MHIFYLYFKSIEQGPVCIVHSLIKLSKSDRKQNEIKKKSLVKNVIWIIFFVCKKSHPIYGFIIINILHQYLMPYRTVSHLPTEGSQNKIHYEESPHQYKCHKI